MMVLGVVLAIVGWLAGIPLLITLGLILLVVGAILWAVGGVRSRPRYW